MSSHDEHILLIRCRQLEQTLRDVCAIIEEIPKADRIRFGLHAIPALKIAQALTARRQQ